MLRRIFVAASFAGIAVFAGCTDSIAPAPTGQIEGGGNMGGDFANEVPRANPGTAVFGSAGGTRPNTSEDAPMSADGGTDGGGEEQAAASDLSEKFYEIAASAGAGGPLSQAVEPDDRAPSAVEVPAANHPPLATFASATETSPALDPQTPYASIVDPAEGELPSTLKPLELTSGGEAIEAVRFSSPAAGQVVVASRIEGSPPRTRLERYDLASGKAVGEVELPDRAELIDVAPDGTRVLVRLTFGLAPKSRPSSSQTRLDVWEMTEADGRHIVGWQPGASEDGAAAVPIGAAFLDGNRVATLCDDGTLSLWNLSEAKAAYSIAAGGKGPLVVTPGRKHLAVFTGTTFAAFEAESGTFRGLLAPPRPTLAACLDAAFSPDGAQLVAVLKRPAQSLLAWDVAAGRPASEVEAPLDLGPGLHFGSPGFAVAGGVLFDLNRKRPVWLYTRNANCRNVGRSPDRRHWVVMQPAFDEPVLTAVAAPTDKVLAAIKDAANLTPPRLGPGDSLAVELKVANFDGDRQAFDEAFAGALGRMLASRGVRLEANAARTLVIDATEKSTGERISFSSIGVGSDESVPAHEIEFTASVVDKAGTVLWADSGRVPPTYSLAKQPDKTLEQVLLETLWATAPTTMAEQINESMPAYLRSTPPEAILGQTRLWAGAEDVSPPNTSLTASSDSSLPSGEGPANVGAVPAMQPSITLTVGSSGTRDLVVARPPLNLIVTTSDDGIARVFQPVSQSRTLRKVDDLRSNSGTTRLALYPDGGMVAFGSEGGEVRVYDMNRKAIVSTFSGADGAITAVSVTDEPMLVAGTQGGRVFCWTEADRAAPTTLAEGQAQITGLAAVPYQNRVVAAWADGTAKLIDVGTGDVVQTFDLDAGRIHGVAVSLDAETIAFATDSAGVVLTSISTGDELSRLDEGMSTAVAFQTDGIHLATANRLGRIVLWNIEEQLPERRLEGAGGKVTTIVFSPDGKSVAAAVAGRRTVPVWTLSPSGGEEPPDESAGMPANSFSRDLTLRSRRPALAHSAPVGSHAE